MTEETNPNRGTFYDTTHQDSKNVNVLEDEKDQGTVLDISRLPCDNDNETWYVILDWILDQKKKQL